MELFRILLLIVFTSIILDFESVDSKGRGGGGRGGGGRGGGSRGSRSRGGRNRVGGSRSSGTRIGGGGGSRTVNTKILQSYWYSRWAIRRNLNPSVRYASGHAYMIRNAILLGYISRPPRHHSKTYLYSDSYINKISICYNENSLYGRNVSQTPWFVCPWDYDQETECCESNGAEKCCAPPQDRDYHVMVVGIVLTTITGVYIVIHWTYKRVHAKNGGYRNATGNADLNLLRYDGSAVVLPPSLPSNNDNITSDDQLTIAHPPSEQFIPRFTDSGNNEISYVNGQAYQSIYLDSNYILPPSYEEVVKKMRSASVQY